jgi:hypothetical protein
MTHTTNALKMDVGSNYFSPLTFFVRSLHSVQKSGSPALPNMFYKSPISELSHALPESFAGTHNFPIIKWHQYFNIKSFKPTRFVTTHVHNGGVGSGKKGNKEIGHENLFATQPNYFL